LRAGSVGLQREQTHSASEILKSLKRNVSVLPIIFIEGLLVVTLFFRHHVRVLRHDVPLSCALNADLHPPAESHLLLLVFIGHAHHA